MNIEGQDSSFERGIVKSDLYEVAESLHAELFEKGAKALAGNPHTRILQRTITPQALESLGSLTIETELKDIGGNLFFMTGSTKNTGPDYSAYDKRHMAAALKEPRKNYGRLRFTAHSHPPDVIGLSAISVGDHEISQQQVGESDVNFIVTFDGVIGHKGELNVPYTPSADGKDPLMDRFRVSGASIKYAIQNPNRTLRQQQETGVMSFFIPFRGDADSQKKLETICAYMNDPSMEWKSIRSSIEQE